MPAEVRSDAKKNRLYVILKGLMEDDEVRITADKVIDAMKLLRPGFTVVTDISEFRPVSQQGVAHIKRVGEAGMKMGMKATCRVLGVSAVAGMQFKRVSRETGYTSFNATSMEEAETLLDGA